MITLHLISHTHWDREWYLPYQSFRIMLVRLVDNLLDLMASDSTFQTFMLDGQTIVLDDYLEIRPEREAVLRELVQSGRLLIGPWHILPDEFLVSPEATVRNLLEGDRTARRFGPKMMVGYIPDPFGHISQMPQILHGFGIDTACIQRGLSDEPCEVWWQAPDGSQVFLAYLRDGYANGAGLPVSDPKGFLTEVRRLRDSLRPYSHAAHLLLMHGNDHMQAPPGTSRAIAGANELLDGDILMHSTLPRYLAEVQAEVEDARSILPTITGELRSSKRHPLLPGVLSARMWIKQRNHACQSLLENWAEPFGVFAGTCDLAFLHRAWRLLMECHPHDSICGCSVDQVHDEMRLRFDGVEQIGEAMTRGSLEHIASQVDTTGASGVPIIVFNPTGITRTDTVRLPVHLPAGEGRFELVDWTGEALPYQAEEGQDLELLYQIFDRRGLQALLTSVEGGQVSGVGTAPLFIQEVQLWREPEFVRINLSLASLGEPNLEAFDKAKQELGTMLEDGGLNRFIIRAIWRETPIHFIAREVPGFGYATFSLRPVNETPSPSSPVTGSPTEPGGKTAGASVQQAKQLTGQQDGCPAERPAERPAVITNEFFTVTASQDGTLTLTDHRSGAVYPGLNRFEDGGDCGDEYNYSPPDRDSFINLQVRSMQVEHGASYQALQIVLAAEIPAGLSEDRKARSSDILPLTILVKATLYPGVARLDLRVEVDNTARDHRLRVHFPAPFRSGLYTTDGHFEIVERRIGLPEWDTTWVEQPRPEVPQRACIHLPGEEMGLMVANRGLPEVEALQNRAGQTEIALTLLRCVGWLSRDDFPTRRGHAGPGFATPGAQMIGKHTFEYSVIPTGDLDGQEFIMPYLEGYAYNTPLRAITAERHSGPLPAIESFVQVDPPAFHVTSIKPAEAGDGWILRGVNLTAKPIEVSITTRNQAAEVYRTNLAEQELSPLAPGADGRIHLPTGGKEILTLKFSSPPSPVGS